MKTCSIVNAEIGNSMLELKYLMKMNVIQLQGNKEGVHYFQENKSIK